MRGGTGGVGLYMITAPEGWGYTWSLYQRGGAIHDHCTRGVGLYIVTVPEGWGYT